MDKTQTVLEEMDFKAATSTDVYDLIMNLIKEASLNLQASRGKGRFLSSGAISKPEDCGQL